MSKSDRFESLLPEDYSPPEHFIGLRNFVDNVTCRFWIVVYSIGYVVLSGIAWILGKR
ncbi:MAG: hypothetical protein LBF88_02995 [Planctomycetaceae bacterium]|jgi:hypothetical protein|nr:hypothetical protein [Planctomycetaceae bacterium]